MPTRTPPLVFVSTPSVLHGVCARRRLQCTYAAHLVGGLLVNGARNRLRHPGYLGERLAGLDRSICLHNLFAAVGIAQRGHANHDFLALAPEVVT